MKRIFCICIALLLCSGLFGCQAETYDPRDTLPPLSDDEVETVLAEENASVYGKIVGKLSPNVLVLEPDSKSLKDAWGEKVYILAEKSEDWCVGDEINVGFSMAERPIDASQYVRIHAEKITALVTDAKPIIYFYPEAPTLCSAKILLNGELTCTYPAHGADGWQNFTAYPDGTLVFPDGKSYYALYWEGVQNTQWDLSRGWCVRGEDTAAFLEWALAQQGLSAREANEFIVYWLPLMQENPYNVISFQTTTYTDGAMLEISPAPDSVLRVFMAYYASDTEVDILPQALEGFERTGFTVVEWGGSQVREP